MDEPYLGPCRERGSQGIGEQCREGARTRDEMMGTLGPCTHALAQGTGHRAQCRRTSLWLTEIRAGRSRAGDHTH